MMQTKELVKQIDLLTQQNQLVINEMNQIKQMLDSGQGDQQNSQGGGGNQNSKNGGGNGGSGGGNNNQNNQLNQLANELMKVKGLIQNLESKTSQYISSQSQGNMTDKDVVSLVLIMMDGMVTWASDYVTNNANSGSNPSQSQSQ